MRASTYRFLWKKLLIERCILINFPHSDQDLPVQTLDNAIHRINLYPADSVIDFRNTYPLDTDLSGG